ncbi:MAG: hypothetical protein HY399_03710 [Elusimicrobia bacterium]|nr:hypothetical protein [Elusimicrobiota bacterium]
MDEMLKGNYKLNKPITKKEAPADNSEQEFEASALQKLGGSIAFVKKSTGFIWKGK